MRIMRNRPLLFLVAVAIALFLVHRETTSASIGTKIKTPAPVLMESAKTAPMKTLKS